MHTLSKQTREFIIKHENQDIRDLALKSSKEEGVDIAFALKQISGRQIAKNKLPLWYSNAEILYPERISMEQCSSQETAEYKESILNDKIKRIADLSGGFGVDFTIMTRKREYGYYVESNKELSSIVSHNLKELNIINSEVHNLKGEEFLEKIPEVDLIYLDPDRRSDNGAKIVYIEECSPNVIEIRERLLHKAETVLLKLSPMLDINKAIESLKTVSDVHIISVNNECKELLLVMNRNKSENIYCHCINIQKGKSISKFSFSIHEELSLQLSHTDILKKYLYEPNASILKAGGFKSVSKTYNINKLHHNSHLYTSDYLIDDFPGRVFEIVESYPAGRSKIKSLAKSLKKANLTVRNFPSTVAEIRNNTKLKDGGDDYLFATTLEGEKHVIIHCTKI